MMSENRSSSVILCSVSRARSSGDSSAALEVLEVVCAKAGSVPADTITAAEPVSFDNCRRVNHVRITTFLCADRNQPKFRAQSQRRWHRLGRVARPQITLGRYGGRHSQKIGRQGQDERYPMLVLIDVDLASVFTSQGERLFTPNRHTIFIDNVHLSRDGATYLAKILSAKPSIFEEPYTSN
jgi:hypothetical protein